MKISVKKMALAMALTAMPMMGFAGNKGPEWLSKAVAYQIYPSSYQDSDGDGIGDIPGITSRLDYIKGLGVNVIWLNPVFVSGWFDGGYDIIDFYKVDPRFGTNTDLVKLIDEAHQRGIRVLLDLVAGHSSDQCQWFKESAQGTDMRYSDYYIWSNEIPQKEVKIIAERKLEADPAVSKRGKWVEADAPRAKYYEKNESSAIGAKGVWKKVSYWIVIGLAFFMSHCFVEMGKIIGIDLSFMMMLGWFTLATYMVNEVRSILENLVRMHVNVPQFLIAGLDVTQKLIDSKTNIKEETKSEEIIYQSTDEGQNGRADSSGT